MTLATGRDSGQSVMAPLRALSVALGVALRGCADAVTPQTLCAAAAPGSDAAPSCVARAKYSLATARGDRGFVVQGADVTSCETCGAEAELALESPPRLSPAVPSHSLFSPQLCHSLRLLARARGRLRVQPDGRARRCSCCGHGGLHLAPLLERVLLLARGRRRALLQPLPRRLRIRQRAGAAVLRLGGSVSLPR